MTSASGSGRVALITGAARRIGAAIARELHRGGYRLALHYRRSEGPVRELVAELETTRAGSAASFGHDLTAPGAAAELACAVLARFDRLDALINNASSFYPTPVGTIRERHWDDLFGTNARAPLFLTQACLPALRAAEGAVVNLIDVHADQPLQQHTVYCMAKAALKMMTRSLALELGPEVRVNGIAPGAILWPEAGLKRGERERLLERLPLKRKGEPADIAGAVRYLLEARYVTGQVLVVDGGRSLLLG